MIMKQVVIHAWNTHTCTCTRKPGELPVRGDLAYTPAQMYEAAKAGVPISSQNLSHKLSNVSVVLYISS